MSLHLAETTRLAAPPLQYETALEGGGRESAALSVEIAQTTGIPRELGGIVATSDLQGLGYGPGRPLLGTLVAEHLHGLCADGLLPPAARLGILLGGDFFARPDRRGGFGDVREVWEAFTDRFRWVVGVAGNHDDLDRASLDRHLGDGTLLDGETIERDRLRIAGLSGVVGKITRPWRRTEADFRNRYRELLVSGADIMLAHDGPHLDDDRPGIEGLVDGVKTSALIVRGHKSWPRALNETPEGVQILNVDRRVVVLLPNDR